MKTMAFAYNSEIVIYYTKTDTGEFKAILEHDGKIYDVTHFSIGRINTLIEELTHYDKGRVHLQRERAKTKATRKAKASPGVTVIKRKRA